MKTKQIMLSHGMNTVTQRSWLKFHAMFATIKMYTAIPASTSVENAFATNPNLSIGRVFLCAMAASNSVTIGCSSPPEHLYPCSLESVHGIIAELRQFLKYEFLFYRASI